MIEPLQHITRGRRRKEADIDAQQRHGTCMTDLEEVLACTTVSGAFTFSAAVIAALAEAMAATSFLASAAVYNGGPFLSTVVGAAATVSPPCHVPCCTICATAFGIFSWDPAAVEAPPRTAFSMRSAGAAGFT